MELKVSSIMVSTTSPFSTLNPINGIEILINLLVKVFVDLDLVGIVLVGVVDADCCLRLRVS